MCSVMGVSIYRYSDIVVTVKVSRLAGGRHGLVPRRAAKGWGGLQPTDERAGHHTEEEVLDLLEKLLHQRKNNNEPLGTRPPGPILECVCGAASAGPSKGCRGHP